MTDPNAVAEAVASSLRTYAIGTLVWIALMCAVTWWSRRVLRRHRALLDAMWGEYDELKRRRHEID